VKMQFMLFCLIARKKGFSFSLAPLYKLFF